MWIPWYAHKYKICTGFSLGCHESIGLGWSPGCSIKMQIHQRRYGGLGSCFIHFICLYLPSFRELQVASHKIAWEKLPESQCEECYPKLSVTTLLGNYGYTVPPHTHNTHTCTVLGVRAPRSTAPKSPALSKCQSKIPPLAICERFNCMPSRDLWKVLTLTIIECNLINE